MFPSHIASVPKRDESQEALRQVEEITGSKLVRGEQVADNQVKDGESPEAKRGR
jgi:hypothetical protein